MKAVNWNTQEDMTNMFWRQNISQMWVETEFKVSKDIASWKTLTDSEKETFKKALAGLTGLDTHQADDGMPLIMLHTTDLRKKAVYSFMAMMEQIHAKSYSHIFTTLLFYQLENIRKCNINHKACKTSFALEHGAFSFH